LLTLFIAAGCGNTSAVSHPQSRTFQGTSAIATHSLSAQTPFQKPFTFSFQSKLACSKNSDSWIRILEAKSSLEISGRVLCADRTLTFVPQIQLTWTKNIFAPQLKTSWIGLHPSAQYIASLSEDIVNTDGETLKEQVNIPFTMSNLDYGIYWFNAQGVGERHFPQISSPFLTPHESTVIFFHGQQKGAVKENMWRGNPFLKTFGNEEPVNLLPLWKQQNFNVGIYFWEQFSDEDEPKSIEVKLWVTPKNGIPFLTSDNRKSVAPSTRTLSNLLCDSYDEALNDIRPQTLRLVAHSTGAQLALHCAERNGENTSALPNRIALLDPFWSRSSLGGDKPVWPGQLSEKKAQWLITTKNTVVEQYKSSPLGGIIGDANLPMRRQTAFARIWANFIPRLSFGMHHNYAVPWYFESIQRPIPVLPGGFLGAAASDEDIRSLMNMTKPNTPQHYSATGPGNLTSSATDDMFEAQPGIDPW
jgi:pimeloyl-ACP methyl ester carboxylesterase/uncharacterized protein YcfL